MICPVYVLNAVIARESLLTTLLPDGLRAVPLHQGFALVPRTDALVDAVGRGGTAREGFSGLDDRLEAWLLDASTLGPVAYVEVETFGAVEERHAAVWDAGQLVGGPWHEDEDSPANASASLVSQALAAIGVDRRDAHDEFDALDLGRHRHTDDWATSPS
jgi:hypothetical protein